MLWGSRPGIWFPKQSVFVRAPTLPELDAMADNPSEDDYVLFLELGLRREDVERVAPERRVELVIRAFRRYGVRILPRYDWRTMLADRAEQQPEDAA